MTRMRIESEGPNGGTIVKLNRPDDDQMATAMPIIRAAIHDMATTGLPPEHVAEHLLGLAVELKADHAAYQRECERRGVLAL